VFGTTVDARVVQIDSYSVRFRYEVGGQSHELTQRTTRGTTPGIRQGDTIRVRTLALPGHRRTFVIDPSGSSSFVGGWGTYCCMVPFTLVWNGLVLWMLLGLWVAPYLERRLIRGGAVAAGTVTGREAKDAGRGRMKYTITYAFDAPGPGRAANADGRRSGNAIVTKEDHDAVDVDSPVTVLYWPDHPNSNTVYEFRQYEAEGAGPVRAQTGAARDAGAT
jgi:hypothetical protein